MPANWLNQSSELPRRASDALESVFRSFAEPARARRLRQVLLVLFAMWAALALSRLIWALLPAGEATLPADTVILNPVTLPAPVEGQAVVDVARMQAWHLFGAVGAAIPEMAQPETATQASARDGIEKGARETRLDLKLRGVVASSEDGLGYAIIEHRSQQEIYAVEDKLPLPGQVSLAKVMPRQVVLDNGGTYELLELFEDSSLDTQLAAQPRVPSIDREAPIDVRPGATASELASSYRERLYQNPQSLADLVTVSAVRENGELRGYRIGPGKQGEQFAQMGFMPGDLVTSVNGIALNDPANTLQLYQTMRTAREAVFDLQRSGQPVTVSVSLGDGPAGE